MVPAPIVDAVAQLATAPPVSPEFVLKVLVGFMAAAWSLLIGAVIYFLRQFVSGIETMKSELVQSITVVSARVDQCESDVQKVTQEVFGVSGTNGMRRDVRRTRSSTIAHERFLIKVAEKFGLEIELPAHGDS